MSKIKVALGSNIKREAVLINPSINQVEPTFGIDQSQADEPSNIIATGENSRQILKRFYGR
jgi:hypothetical protein